MKILEITRSFYPSLGGLEHFVSSRIEIFNYLGHKVDVLTTDYSTEKILAKKIFHNVIYLKQFSKYNFIRNLKAHFRADYDLVSVNQIGNYLSDQSIMYYHKLGIKILLTPHFSFHTNKYNLLKKIHDYIIKPTLLDKVDRIICFTEYEKKFWMEKFKIADEKLVVIPQHIQSPESSVPTNPQNYILYLGRNDRNKRIDLLLDAFTQLKNINYDLYLTLPKNDFHSLTSNTKVIFLGNVDESSKQKLLANCAALIYPSDYEAFGRTLLEASLYMKPIICSGLQVFREILDQRGALYFNNNLYDLKNTLKHFNSLDKVTLDKMGEYNFFNLNNYSYQKAYSKYATLFNGLFS